MTHRTDVAFCRQVCLLKHIAGINSQVDDEISNCSDSHQCLDGASLRLFHMTTLSGLPNNS